MNSEIAATNLESVSRKRVSSPSTRKPTIKSARKGPRRKTTIKKP
jgi:hypothetical protein